MSNPDTNQTNIIYKYVLASCLDHLRAKITIPIPMGSKIISVGTQEPEVLCVWAEVFRADGHTRPPVPYTFFIIGTGQALPQEGCRFIGTVQLKPGTVINKNDSKDFGSCVPVLNHMVWHVYCNQGE